MGYLIAARKQVVDGEPPPILLRVVENAGGRDEGIPAPAIWRRRAPAALLTTAFS
jgi:hypothetical protein